MSSYNNNNNCAGSVAAYPGSSTTPSSVVYDVETTAWRWVYLLLIAVVILGVLALAWWALKKEARFFSKGSRNGADYDLEDELNRPSRTFYRATY
jgi:hypothetical protein